MIPLKDNIPSKKIPIVNYVLLFLNSCIFIYQLTLLSQNDLEQFIQIYAVKPAYLLSNPIYEAKTIFSAMFLHGSWLHFLGNMIYLYIFGDNVEDKFGHIKFLIFYLFCGTVATLFQVGVNPSSKIPIIGASGAISGVLGAYLVFFPRAKILTLVPIGLLTRIVYIPAFLFLGFWFIIQIHALTLSSLIPSRSNIAWWAHVGGFLVGIVIAVKSKSRR